MLRAMTTGYLLPFLFPPEKKAGRRKGERSCKTGLNLFFRIDFELIFEGGRGKGKETLDFLPLDK